MYPIKEDVDARLPSERATNLFWLAQNSKTTSFKLFVRFRWRLIALSADIAKIYLQVALNETDCDFHRILWRSDASKPMEHYRFVRVTYGIASSAFHSNRTLHAIADSQPSSLASTVLKRDFYVDDLLSWAKTVTEALALQQSLIDTLKHGGFDLRKWSSNDRSVLAHMSADMLETKDIAFDETHTLKTLASLGIPPQILFCSRFLHHLRNR